MYEGDYFAALRDTSSFYALSSTGSDAANFRGSARSSANGYTYGSGATDELRTWEMEGLLSESNIKRSSETFASGSARNAVSQTGEGNTLALNGAGSVNFTPFGIELNDAQAELFIRDFIPDFPNVPDFELGFNSELADGSGILSYASSSALRGLASGSCRGLTASSGSVNGDHKAYINGELISHKSYSDSSDTYASGRTYGAAISSNYGEALSGSVIGSLNLCDIIEGYVKPTFLSEYLPGPEDYFVGSGSIVDASLIGSVSYTDDAAENTATAYGYAYGKTNSAGINNYYEYTTGVLQEISWARELTSTTEINGRASTRSSARKGEGTSVAVAGSGNFVGDLSLDGGVTYVPTVADANLLVTFNGAKGYESSSRISGYSYLNANAKSEGTWNNDYNGDEWELYSIADASGVGMTGVGVYGNNWAEALTGVASMQYAEMGPSGKTAYAYAGFDAEVRGSNDATIYPLAYLSRVNAHAYADTDGTLADANVVNGRANVLLRPSSNYGTAYYSWRDISAKAEGPSPQTALEYAKGVDTESDTNTAHAFGHAAGSSWQGPWMIPLPIFQQPEI